MFISLLTMTSLAACGSSTDTGGTQSDKTEANSGSETVKVGVVLTVTGPQAVTGKWALEGHQQAVNEINDSGGFQVGDKTYKLEIVHYDTEGKTESATAATEKLINQDKVNIILGTSSSSETNAMIPIAQREKIPLITAVAASPILNEQGAKYFTSAAAQNTNFTLGVSKTVKDAGWGQVAVLHLNDAWGESSAKTLIPAMEALGVKVVFKEAFAPQNKEFATLLNKAKGANPEGLILIGQTEITVPIIKQAREIMPDTPIMDTGGSILDEIARLVPAESEGMIGFNRSGRVEEEVHKEFKEKFKKNYNYDPNSFNYSGYDGIYLVVDAFKRAGTVTDREKINEAVRASNFDGLMGNYTFDDKGNNKITGLRGLIINGKVQYQTVNDPLPSEVLK
jgi:branched-chain amino acid transport system substrate-binding protein